MKKGDDESNTGSNLYPEGTKNFEPYLFYYQTLDTENVQFLK